VRWPAGTSREPRPDRASAPTVGYRTDRRHLDAPGAHVLAFLKEFCKRGSERPAVVLRAVQHDNVREHNRHAVLRALQERRSASRAELARATGLSVPTVTAIEQEFAASGLVQQGAP